MPITTPTTFVERYKDDVDHFTHVLEHLFIPALNEAGFEPIPPKAEGSNVIHADIIKQLSECELVLCDMSILNPNVFYEFGIRTALDKPVALVVDDKTKPIPFDTGIINFHKYESSLAAWTLDEQKKILTKHVQNAYKKSKDHNALWKYFGVTQTGTFKPEEAELGNKMDVIMKQLSALERQQDDLIDTREHFVPKSNNVTIEHTPSKSLRTIKRSIAKMFREGKSTTEIANNLALSKGYVEHAIKKITEQSEM